MPNHKSENHAAPISSRDTEPTLLPMLIAGLVLVVIGAVIVMTFV